jgi:hypothetical protein
MPISLPNLDDRRYADLVEEARDLLVAYAPALTDHNPSDPAVTLMELFAYFTEALLFRVNVVTVASRIKFLQLINGPNWPIPPSPDELDAQVRSTVLALRSTDRAVTPADFEFLARLGGAGGVARAQCIPERNLEATDPTQRAQSQPGHVSVVIVPSPGGNLASLSTTVAAYLDPRRLLTAVVHIVGPRVVPIGIQLTVRLMPDALESQVLPRVTDALTSFLDPIVGRDGNGWPFGRNVYVSELYRLLDKLPGVDFVRRTLDTTTSAPIDELVTTADFAGRFVRNAAGDLISVALDVDELPSFQTTTTAITIEQPPTTF